MTWWIFSVLASATLAFIEYVNSTTKGTWLVALWRTAPAIVLAQWFLFRAFNGAPHLLVAWATLTIGTCACRVAAVKLAGMPVESWPMVLLGITGMIGFSFVLKEGLR